MGGELASRASKEPVKAGLLSSSAVKGMVIVGICLLAYANTFRVPFQYDDVDRMIKRPFVQDVRQFFDPAGRERFANEDAFRMRTMAYFTFALNYWLHGTDVVGYHILNLVIHAVNAFLLYFLVVLSFRTPVLQRSSLKDRAHTLALFSALLFASHPIQTEAVTYIVQRLTSLATLFYLLSLVLYIKWRLAGREETGVRSGESSGVLRLAPHASPVIRWFFYSASLLSAVLAMKTKEIAFTLPVAIALYEAMFFRGEVKKRALCLVPLLLTMLIIPIGLIGTGKPLGEMMSDASTVTRVQSALSRGEYLATEFRVLVTYMRLLFFPAGQNLDYDYPLHHSFMEPSVYLSFLLLLSILGLGVYCLYRSRLSAHDAQSSGPDLTPYALRLIAFGIFWFFLTLSVESGVIPIADVIFEHRLYLPSAGAFLALTSALFYGAERLKARWAAAEKAIMAVLATSVLLLTGLSYARNTVWQSEVSLWRDVIQKSPLKARGYNGLGLAYYNMRQYDKAIEEFSRAVVLHPSYGVAFNNLGNAFYQKGLYDRAIEPQTRAISLEPRNPVFLFNRGLTYAAKGEYDRAIENYEGAIDLDPAYSEAYNNLGIVYYQKGLYPLAVEAYTKSIAFDPGKGIFYNNRGLAYSGSRDYGRAIDDYTRAIALSPDLSSAYNGRGSAYGFLGRYDEAIADFTRAISLEPGSAALYTNRGVAYARAGRRDKALSDFQRACDMGDENGCRALQTALRQETSL